MKTAYPFVRSLNCFNILYCTINDIYLFIKAETETANNIWDLEYFSEAAYETKKVHFRASNYVSQSLSTGACRFFIYPQVIKKSPSKKLANLQPLKNASRIRL